MSRKLKEMGLFRITMHQINLRFLSQKKIKYVMIFVKYNKAKWKKEKKVKDTIIQIMCKNSYTPNV